MEHLNADKEQIELFKMEENKTYSVLLRAITTSRMGKQIDIKSCYMEEPKSVSFPRVEITTENYIWPDCDFVGSPSGCWGAGITNAFYEQCVVTIYDKNNEIFSVFIILKYQLSAFCFMESRYLLGVIPTIRLKTLVK